MNTYIIISGIPASGKTTVAVELARALSLPLFDKDAFLEAQFVDRPPATPSERTQLSRRTDLVLQEAVGRSNGAVVASWWRHPLAGGDSGTPIEWLPAVSGHWVEIYCSCPASVAAERFLRRTRHLGHFDRRWSYDELLEQFEADARLGPLRVGQLVEVNTGDVVEIEPLAERIRRLVP